MLRLLIFVLTTVAVPALLSAQSAAWSRRDPLDRTHQRGELEKARPHTIRPFDDPSLRHHVLHVLLPSLEDGRDTSACAEIGVTIA